MYTLPPVQNLLDKQFAVISTENETVDISKQTTPVLHKYGVYFVGISDEFTNQWVWKRANVIKDNISYEKLLNNADKPGTTVVLNQSGGVTGILKEKILGRLFYQSYCYHEAFLETILQTLEESCTVIDENEKVLYWTKGAEQIFSYSPQDIVGRPITDFFNYEMLEITNALKSGRAVHRHQHKARDDLIVLINSNPVYLNGRIIGAVVSETDITSQVRMNREFFQVSTKVRNLEKEVEKLKPSNDPFDQIKGSSTVLKKTKEQIEKIAETSTSVLVFGESGVGKELFAKAIHGCRETENAPFIPINCGAIPHALFESELFGYERGAFSGANQKGKKGQIEMARNGTLFLDEIGEMPLDMQVKLLRVLQEKKYFPVGGTKEISVNFRIIAATNKNLHHLVQEGKFREDLYYRLNVVSLIIPPLRERQEDIIELTHYFLFEFSTRYQKPIHGISQEVMQKILQYAWPGNVRELRNVIERLIVFSDNGSIKSEDLPFIHSDSEAGTADHPPNTSLTVEYDESRTLNEQLEDCEREVIRQALEKSSYNKLICAQKLGVSRATLYNKMNKLQLL